MSQQTVLTFLESQKGKKFLVTELMIALGLGNSTLTNNCRKLRKEGVVKFESVPQVGKKPFRYWVD